MAISQPQIVTNQDSHFDGPSIQNSTGQS